MFLLGFFGLGLNYSCKHTRLLLVSPTFVFNCSMAPLKPGLFFTVSSSDVLPQEAIPFHCLTSSWDALQYCQGCWVSCCLRATECLCLRPSIKCNTFPGKTTPSPSQSIPDQHYGTCGLVTSLYFGKALNFVADFKLSFSKFGFEYLILYFH